MQLGSLSNGPGLARGQDAAQNPLAALARWVGHFIIGISVNDNGRAIGIQES